MRVADITAKGHRVRLRPDGKIGVCPPTGDDHQLRAAILANRAAIIEELKRNPPKQLERQMPKYPDEGPGTELKKLIKLPACCACKAYAGMMNRWGVDGCEERFDQIVDWLVEQAKARKITSLAPEALTRPVARAFLRKAIRLARQRDTEQNHDQPATDE